MRRIAGALGDGTITWMAGRRAIGEAIAPDVRAAAREAGRPEPRILVGLPVALTNDPAAARAQASKTYAVYGTLPSYRAMLDAEGVKEPGEIAIVGDEKTLEREIRALADAGATDFQAAIFGVGEDRKASVVRTRALLAALAKG
jgi:alkanesulfonate monooxygenase SsuD/methylene tetrahydromethanopterin reductase-like flavin-dependent oxidoreductase (luciferase family)